MANNQEGLNKAKFTRLKTKATKLGIPFEDDISYDTLQAAVDEYEEAMEAAGSGDAAAASKVQAIEIGKAIAGEMGKVMRTVVKDAPDDQLFDERDIDPDDAAPEKCYFTPQYFWILPAKRIGGQLVRSPYNRKLVFKMSSGDSVQNGFQENTRYISILKSSSRREQAYIESHPLYKRVFHPNIADVDVSSDQLKFALCFNKHYQSVSNKMAPQLYRQAGDLGVRLDASMSLNTLRSTIAEHLATREISGLKLTQKAAAQTTARQELLQSPDDQE